MSMQLRKLTSMSMLLHYGLRAQRHNIVSDFERSFSKCQHLEPNYVRDSFAKSVAVIGEKKVFTSQGNWTCLDSQQYSPPLHQLGRIPDRDAVQVNTKKVTNYMNKQFINVPHCTTINLLTVDSPQRGRNSHIKTSEMLILSLRAVNQEI